MTLKTLVQSAEADTSYTRTSASPPVQPGPPLSTECVSLAVTTASNAVPSTPVVDALTVSTLLMENVLLAQEAVLVATPLENVPPVKPGLT